MTRHDCCVLAAVNIFSHAHHVQYARWNGRLVNCNVHISECDWCTCRHGLPASESGVEIYAQLFFVSASFARPCRSAGLWSDTGVTFSINSLTTTKMDAGNIETCSRMFPGRFRYTKTSTRNHRLDMMANTLLDNDGKICIRKHKAISTQAISNTVVSNGHIDLIEPT